MAIKNTLTHLFYLVNIIGACASASRHVRKANTEVCFGEIIGCFDNKGPFEHMHKLPDSPEKVGTKFFVFSPGRENKSQVFHFNDFRQIKGLEEFKNVNETKVIVHGFGSSCEKNWVQQMKNALFSVVRAAVVCVDWSHGAVKPHYRQASANARLVGKQVGLLITDLRTSFPDLKVHIIGHSLGAQIAGFAGQSARNVTRISGLDPAGLYFESAQQIARLDETDALFVDVIHTSGNSLINGGFGSLKTLGHADFFPNGGKGQGGCPKRFITTFVKSLVVQRPKSKKPEEELGAAAITDPYGGSMCNHQRAVKLYIESIVSQCQFTGYKCSNFENFVNGDQECITGSTRPMGYYADTVPWDSTNLRQPFYLVTRPTAPFCGEQTLVEVKIASSQEDTRGKLEIELYFKFRSAEHPSALSTEMLVLKRSSNEKLHRGEVFRGIIAAPLNQTALPQIVLNYKASKRWFSKGSPVLTVEKVGVKPLGGQRVDNCHSLRLNTREPIRLEVQTFPEQEQPCYFI